MSPETLKIIKKIQFCEGRWMAAMKRPGYRDDPFEADEKEDPFTEQDWALYGWADSWRLLTHKYENLLDQTWEASQARARLFRNGETHTHYVSEMSFTHLASLSYLKDRKK
jgi:hypothetical protein